MIDITDSLPQLKRAVADREITRLFWRSYPDGVMDCVPLSVGNALLTVCEIESFIRYNRIVTIRLSDIESLLPVHGYREFIHWALQRNAQVLPSVYPQLDSFHGLLADLAGSEHPITFVNDTGVRRPSTILSVTDTDVIYQQIDFCGYFCWPERIRLDRIIRVDAGGIYETCLIEHARSTPNCFNAESNEL